MAKAPYKDEALEALDFVINVLKEHEKTLDHLIVELGEITKRLGETGELSKKIEKIDERMRTFQAELSSMMGPVSSARENATHLTGLPVVVKCEQWEDLRILASGAETISFQFKQEEKTFQADALKEGRVLTYKGDFPPNTRLLKLWLSRELHVAEEKIFEGILAIG
jgi:hypothetical protein